MAINDTLTVAPLGGLDLINDESTASPSRARASRNVHKRETSALKRRQGQKVVADNSGNSGGMGTFVYKNRDFSDGTISPEVLLVGSKLYKLSNYLLNVAYSGAGQAVCEVLVDEDTLTWHFYLYVDSVEVLDYDMGVGFDETTPSTITDLKTQINATADFAATSSGGETSPCAFLTTTVAQLVTTSIDIGYQVATEVNHPTGASDPFAQLSSQRNSDMFENASAVEMADVIFIGTKWDYQVKYDGVTCYRSGMPAPANPSGSGSGAGGLAAGTYKYKTIAVQVDAKNNRVEGIASGPVTITTVGAQNINLTVPQIVNTTGFNTDCGVVAGAQVAVNTITVDNGSGGSHTLKEGQTAYFYDGVSAAYVEREITAVAATTITVAGAAVTVADNAVISANLRIMILRTVTGGSVYRVHSEVPNNSFVSSYVVNDGIADASLGADFIDPADTGIEHGLPPVGGYLSAFTNTVVVSGDPEAPDTFYWASEEGPEYYPGLYSDFIAGGENFSITGLKGIDRFFWIHKENETYQLVGNLFTGQYSVDKKGSGVGCLAHASIVETDGLVIWLGNNGFYGSRAGSDPELISYDISPLFRTQGKASELTFRFSRVVAAWDKDAKNYIAFMPCESEQSGERYANSNSIVLVFDTIRLEWWSWDNLNMAGGVAVYDNDLYYMEKRYSEFDGNVLYGVHKRLNTDSLYDYVDHTEDIPWTWESAGCIDLGQPNVDKKFTHIVHWCSDAIKVASFTLQTNIEKDNVRGAYYTQLTTAVNGGGGEGWGFLKWGFGAWGNPVANSNSKRRLKAVDAKTVRVLFSAEGIYREIALAKFQLMYNAPFRVKIARTNENG